MIAPILDFDIRDAPCGFAAEARVVARTGLPEDAERTRTTYFAWRGRLWSRLDCHVAQVRDARAECESLRKRCAWLTWHGNVAGCPGARERFRREAAACAAAVGRIEAETRKGAGR